MKILAPVSLLLSFSVAVVAKRPSWQDVNESYTFEKYMNDFSKSYETEEEMIRRKHTFEVHLQRVIAHNSQRTTGHVLGVNHLMDLEPHELPLGYDKSGHSQHVLASERKLTSSQVRDNLSGLPAAARTHNLLRRTCHLKSTMYPRSQMRLIGEPPAL